MCTEEKNQTQDENKKTQVSCNSTDNGKADCSNFLGGGVYNSQVIIVEGREIEVDMD